MIRTPLCDLLGVEYPVFQGGMAWIADGKLAAAVSEGGGLGIIAAGNAPGDAVREQIQVAKSLTSRPFGVNIMLMSPFVEEVAQVVAEEKVAVVTTGAGNPTKYMALWKEAGIRVIPVVASVAMAKLMTRLGASALIAEGGESGGHVGELTTMVLVPQICDATTLPVIAAAALEEGGLRADMAAGFSLGEIGALTYTRAVDLETGFHLVCRRGELMQAAAEEQPTAMAAVLKLSNEEVEQICAQFAQVYPVNYNCPGQVSVACAKEQLAPFSAAVKAAGGRALPLKVRGGFHSPFMATAAQGFAQVLEECRVGQPEMPLYSNRTGAVYEGDPKTLLSQQIASPVRWETIVRNMIAAGADTFVELGPGKTLCGLIEKIDKTVKTYALSTQADLETILKEVKGC